MVMDVADGGGGSCYGITKNAVHSRSTLVRPRPRQQPHDLGDGAEVPESNFRPFSIWFAALVSAAERLGSFCLASLTSLTNFKKLI